MQQNGCALQFADKWLRQDYDIVKAAVLSRGRAFAYALGDIRKDPELARLALEDSMIEMQEMAELKMRDEGYSKPKEHRSNFYVQAMAVKEDGDFVGFVEKKFLVSRRWQREAGLQN